MDFIDRLLICTDGKRGRILALAFDEEYRKPATLDRRHFGMIRPQHIGALCLLPE